ncbi:MAG: NADH-quinone oxidoreductase subunit NuoK [Longimicrobiales bacterium]|jgi:NADH-quinone oxidoreductase subunit K|nr:NADH-quinone oxidoreductase subunit NuoK [Longimicrobiales bacterium]
MVTEALFLSVMIFIIGTLGVIIRRNAIIMFLCVELQLNAVNLAFVALSRHAGIEGQLFVFFVMTVAAAEAAVGLAIIISIFRHYETVITDNFSFLRW